MIDELAIEAVTVIQSQGKGKDDKDNEWNQKHNRVRGPFYCGITLKMVLQEYNIRLCGPTSTSSSVEVAHRLAGNGRLRA